MEPVLLTVRGTLNPKNLDEARSLHNATAGSKEGIEGARALSDLSHCVYAPVVHEKSDAKKGELLFIDTWQDPAGLQQFFSNKHVQEQGGKLFSARDGSVWMPARGSFSLSVPATSSKPAKFVALLRAKVTSAEKAIDFLNKMMESSLQAARRRGLLSHAVYVRMGAPSDPVEVLGVDFWPTLEGLGEHYADASVMKGLEGIVAGPPSGSVWEQAAGFNEW